ncbi:carboxypeptidase-like regulatory domain-containing protein [Methanococcoides sp. FTZ1]|uniref:carboxypeptidase-like regulatory domain-containing protein n=1 Tax=Methanococcoides sp. FTZ1 TaxID=3439061 RepID=UPI003F847066
MKNIMGIIAAMLCIFLLATVGVGAAEEQQKLPPRYRVVQFDVTYHDEIVGKLSVNTNQWTYVLNAHGLEPDTEYHFYCRGKFFSINNETANEYGNLHMKGEWPQEIDVVGTTPEFAVGERLPLGTWCYTPQFTVKCYVGLLRSTVWGTLTDSSGNPLPDQLITVFWYDKKTDTWEAWFSVTTDTDGAFKVTSSLTPKNGVKAISYEGEYDGTTYCDTWAYATYESGVQL